jgi:HAD superfamily hydrolase (TIGR01549 family)
MATVLLTTRRDDATPQLVGAVGLRNPIDPRRPIRAVLFDVDGTLYRQTPVRALMALELLTLPTQGAGLARRRWRALRAYRRGQEELRQVHSVGSVAAAQIAMAATESGLTVRAVERLVHEWMFTRPLKYLRRCRAPGLTDFLQLLDRTGVRAGVLSDYPAHEKLCALGLAERFWPVLCSTDQEVGALKPHPRGFLEAARVWDVDPSTVLVVGDRPDVDAAGAAAAGMSCVLIGGRAGLARRLANVITVSSFERLGHVLDPHG